MSVKAPNKKVLDAQLVRAAAEAPCYPGLDRVGQKLARGLAEFLAGLMTLPANVTSSSARIAEVKPDAALVIRHVALEPAPGKLQIAIARADLMRLVDVYYGGDGSKDAVRDQLSPAESRFLARIADAICALMAAAWVPFGSIRPVLDNDVAPQNGEAAIQTFTVALPDLAAFDVQFRYPRAILEAFPELQSADAMHGEQALADHRWQARLMGRALDVSLPVRAIFAEPEVPLARLMSLRPGDIIPVCLPTTIELSVAGLPFARGTAGESNGRAAICIDQI